MDEEILDQVQELFRGVYNILYNKGNMDMVADQVEQSGDIVKPVSSMVSMLLIKVFDSGKGDSVDVLLGLAILTISDILETLQELGVEIPEDIMPQIIQETTTITLKQSEGIKEMFMNSPEGAEMLKNLEGGQAPSPSPAPPQSPQSAPPGIPAPPSPANIPPPGVMGQPPQGVV